MWTQIIYLASICLNIFFEGDWGRISAAENWGSITKNLIKKFEFYEQKHNFFFILKIISTLPNELHYMKASFYSTLKHWNNPFCPVLSALEGLPIPIHQLIHPDKYSNSIFHKGN